MPGVAVDAPPAFRKVPGMDVQVGPDVSNVAFRQSLFAGWAIADKKEKNIRTSSKELRRLAGNQRVGFIVRDFTGGFFVDIEHK